jgi:drug/metabolite transporter (DMT)-like permease
MKHAHNVNTDEDGKPIKHFIWIPFWWVGVIGIVGGEVGNLIAYGYAPASVVTPMGAIGVVTNVFITYFFLHEPVTKINVFGVVCIVIGIVVVVYFSPATTIVIKSATFYEDVVQSTECIIYLCIVAVGSMIMIPASKKYGDRHVTVYVVTCAVIASLTIVSAKAFSSLLSSAFANGFEADWLNPWPYILLAILAGTAVFSMSYINSAMMIFGNSQVGSLLFMLTHSDSQSAGYAHLLRALHHGAHTLNPKNSICRLCPPTTRSSPQRRLHPRPLSTRNSPAWLTPCKRSCSSLASSSLCLGYTLSRFVSAAQVSWLRFEPSCFCCLPRPDTTSPEPSREFGKRR